MRRRHSVRASKPRALLAVLLLHANEVVPADRLIDDLWAEDSPQSATAALRVNVSSWTFAGADFKGKRTKWRCPSGECSPASRWIKSDRLHALIPREAKRWRSLYRGRAAVEREFGRLKNEYGLAPLRVRGLERVALHADLTMLARLSQALARARVVPLAA